MNKQDRRENNVQSRVLRTFYFHIVCLPVQVDLPLLMGWMTTLPWHPSLAETTLKNGRNVRIGEEGHRQYKGDFFFWPLSLPWPFIKDNSNLQLFCRSLSRESRHCRASSSEGLNQAFSGEEKATVMRRELTTFTDNVLEPLSLETIHPVTHSQDKGVWVIFFLTIRFGGLGFLSHINTYIFFF